MMVRNSILIGLFLILFAHCKNSNKSTDQTKNAFKEIVSSHENPDKEEVPHVSSCSSGRSQGTISNNIFGKWEVESFKASFVHAIIDAPLGEVKIPQDKVNIDFSIGLNRDSSFVFHNDNGATFTGKFALKDSILDLNNHTIDWLSFRVDSVNESHLYLLLGKGIFYSIAKDTATWFLGDSVVIVMAKK
ncbi:MAG: hypothetical protein NVV82_13230 [Sporocytophaga sp.]|nr:hypothetical protein [Sporocytophaga sp.]